MFLFTHNDMFLFTHIHLKHCISIIFYLNSFTYFIFRFCITMTPVKWTPANMAAAVEKVKNKTLGLRKASREYQIPLRTLRDHIKRDISTGHGRPPVLTQRDENKLVARVQRLSKIGFGLRPDEIKKAVYQYCKLNNLKNPFNSLKEEAERKWPVGFLKRKIQSV